LSAAPFCDEAIRLEGWSLRKLLSGIVAIALAFGAPLSAPAQSSDQCTRFTGTVSAKVSDLLLQFPQAGPALRATVARLVEAEPALAREMVSVSDNATAAQKEAIGAGLADAASFFAKCGVSCKDAEQKVRSAISFADSGTRVGYVMAATPTMSQGIPGFGNTGATTSGGLNPNCNSVMSQSRPC
jgi:hypothetical protein